MRTVRLFCVSTVHAIFLTFLGEAPVDPSADVNQVHGLHARVVFRFHTLVEHKKVVAVDARACRRGG